MVSPETQYLMFNYSTCAGNVQTCPDAVCDPLEQLDSSLCPQDCVETQNIRMSVLVNTGHQGIKSVRTENVTCTCDISSCQCFPSHYQQLPTESLAMEAAAKGFNKSSSFDVNHPITSCLTFNINF